MPFKTSPMTRLILLLTLLITLTLTSCKGQTQTKQQGKTNIDNYKTEILSEDEMRITADKAVKLIQDKNYKDFKNLFVQDIAKNISDQQITQLVDQINILFQKGGVPIGNDNILSSLNATVNGGDTLFVNNIMYNFKPFSDGQNSFQYVLLFSFLKKYGTQKLVGVNVKTNPLSAGNSKPTIKPIDNFKFNMSDIKRFRIYYDEGEARKTKFKNETGYFAIEGGLGTIEKSGLKPIIQAVLSELSKSKFEKVEPFNSTIDKDKVNFIQIELGFNDQSYSLQIYLPIKNGGQYANKIVLLQKEYANLGYEYILNQKDYPKTTTELPKIAEMNLDEYYLDKP